MRNYREHLEELVKERTAELVKANEQLQREIDERKQVEEEKEEIQTQLFQLTKWKSSLVMTTRKFCVISKTSDTGHQ